MDAVKVLPKGQITIPRNIRKSLDIEEGDTVIIEESDNRVILRKGKTIFDYARSISSGGMSVNDLREAAIEEAVKDRA